MAWLINDILSDDRARSTGFGLNSTLKLDRTAAVKTGTTTNFHDNWTIGYTPDLLVGVWVGNSNYEAMHNVTGVTGAAPIWNETMRALLQGQPDRPFVQPGRLEAGGGVRAFGPAAHTRLPAHAHWNGSSPAPSRPSPIPITSRCGSTPSTGALADDSTPPERRKPLIVLDLPVEAQPWARPQGLPLLADIKQDQALPSRADSLALISPLPNTTYRITADFNQSAQQLSVEAVAGQGFSRSRSIWMVSRSSPSPPPPIKPGGNYPPAPTASGRRLSPPPAKP